MPLSIRETGAEIDLTYHTHMALLAFTSVHRFVTSQWSHGVAASMVVDVLQQIGAERVLERIRTALDLWQPDFSMPSDKRELSEMLYFSSLIVGDNRSQTTAVWAAYCRDPTFGRVVGALSRSYAAPAKNWDVEVSNWKYSCHHIRYAISLIYPSDGR